MRNADLFYVALIAVFFLFDQFVLWPAFLRRASNDPGRARLQYWSVWMTLMWALTIGGIVVWGTSHRALTLLGFVAPTEWRLLFAIGLILVLVALYSRDGSKVARSSKARQKLRTTFQKLLVILPHTRLELGMFIGLSLTAGFCEEFIFRGYLIWFFQPRLTWWGSAALCAIFFAVGHSYQGASGILRTGVIGLVMTLVLAVSRSLWPGIVLHALIDIGSGIIGWLILRPLPSNEA